MTQEVSVTDYGAAYAERQVDADGFTIRYLEAGDGRPLVYFHGGGGLHLSRALDLLAERFRVLAFELPGSGDSPENSRTRSLDELAETMAAAIEGIASLFSESGSILTVWRRTR